MKLYEPNRLVFETESGAEQFLVVGETFYPKGWNAYIDGKEAEIIQVNHLIRGVEIPAGNHEVRFEFEPSSYFTSMSMVWIGNIFTLLLIAVPFYFDFKKKKRLD